MVSMSHGHVSSFQGFFEAVDTLLFLDSPFYKRRKHAKYFVIACMGLIPLLKRQRTGLCWPTCTLAVPSLEGYPRAPTILGRPAVVHLTARFGPVVFTPRVWGYSWLRYYRLNIMFVQYQADSVTATPETTLQVDLRGFELASVKSYIA